MRQCAVMRDRQKDPALTQLFLNLLRHDVVRLAAGSLCNTYISPANPDLRSLEECFTGCKAAGQMLIGVAFVAGTAFAFMLAEHLPGKH